MKKIILVLIVMVAFFASCCNKSNEQKKVITQQEQQLKGFDVIIIDSCEYLIKMQRRRYGACSYSFGFMAHKGNCRFCAEREKNKQ